MYDIRFIREQAERFDRGLINRGAEPLSARLIALDDERRAAITASQSEALAAKLALLEEAKAIDPSKDLAKAKQLLLSIQDRWEKAGRVSRNDLAKTEDKLKAIEASVRNAERDHWKATDPAAKARKDDVTIKLEEAIAKLESERTAALRAGNAYLANQKIAEWKRLRAQRYGL